MDGLFAYILHGKIIGDNLFSFTMGRTLAFRWRHDGVVDQSRQVVMFKREYTTNEKKGRKCLEYKWSLS